LIIITLSHLKPFFRPYIFLKTPDSVEKDRLSQIPFLMQMYDNGFFKHLFGTYKTANLLFEIPSEYSRTKKEQLLISIIIDKNSKFNTVLTQKLLEGFAEEITKIKSAFKAFYLDSQVYKGDKGKYDDIKKLLDTFYITFPKKDVIFEQKEANILVFGLFLAGKTTLIRCRRKSVSKTIFPTISVDISKILVNNVSLLTYDTPGQSKFKEIWKPYLKNQDGLIFVLDITDKIKFPDAFALLHEIAGREDLRDLPILILFNKVDIEKPDNSEINELVNAMALEQLGKRPIKYFLTSGIKNINVDEAFNWLSLKIAERLETYVPRSEVGIIFCRWDENLGVKIESVYPEDAFEDPELIAIKSFSVSQFFLAGTELKQNSVILPFPHLNSYAAIYFDYIPDESIRGGLLPLCVIVYYNENFPKEIIGHFNNYIFEVFDDIKTNYEDKSKVINLIKSAQNTIINQIDQFRPSIETLKLAELRYEALFKAARDAILIIERRSGIIIDANKQAEKLFQLPFEDFIALHSSQLLTDDISVDFYEKIIKQIENPVPLITNIISIAGNLVPVEISVNEIKVGQQVLVQCIIRDISKRIETERKLWESENKYRHLFQDSPFSILLIDSKGVVVDCNPAFEKSLGFKKGELIGKKFVELSLIQEDYLINLLKRFKKDKKDRIFSPIEIQLYKRDGSLIWALMQTSIVKIENHTFHQTICQDITEKKKIEQDLTKILKLLTIITRIISKFIGVKNVNQAVYESLKEVGEFINSNKILFYIFNKEYNFIDRSFIWYSKVSYPHSEAPKEIVPNRFPWLNEKLKTNDYFYIQNIDDLPSRSKSIKVFLQDQNIKNCLVYSIKINNILEGLIFFGNILDEDYWGFRRFDTLCIFPEILENVIEREIIKEGVLKSEEEFHRQFDQEYFYRELFVNDIYNIVTSLLTLIEEFSKKQSQYPTTFPKNWLNNVISQCTNSLQLISIIRTLTLLNESKIVIKRVDLKDVIEDVLDYFVKVHINKKINLTIEIPDEDIYLLADEFLFDVFTNVIFSSIKYNPNPSVDFKIIIYQTLQDNVNYIKIEFIDYKSEISHIQKETFLTKNIEKDSNIKELLIGFLLVEQILNNYNGKIWVEGGNFVIMIPKA
jgi:PAS domain S-box-containing protein/small GTP-binding protein